MMDGLCGKCAWCMEGHYCRRKHKEVAFFGQEKCYTTEDEFRIMFAQQVKDIEQDTNKLTQNAKKSTRKAKKMEEKTITTKVCKDCGRELPIDQFQKQFRSSDGYMHICKECKSMRVAQGVENKIKEDLNKKDKELKDKLFKMGNTEGVVEKGILIPCDGTIREEIHLFTEEDLVEELRLRGWDVTCTKTISL